MQIWQCVGMVVVNIQWLLLKLTSDMIFGMIKRKLTVGILAREFTSLSS